MIKWNNLDKLKILIIYMLKSIEILIIIELNKVL